MSVNPPRSRGAAPARKRAINSRTKGHNYERWLRSYFREHLGLSACQTTRFASRLLDNCGIDLCNIPFLVSAKTGYKTKRPKPEQIFAYVTGQLLANFPSSDPLCSQPIFLFHKLDGKTPEAHVVSMRFSDWVLLVKAYLQYTGHSSPVDSTRG